MKLKIIFICALFTLAFASCKKCEICTPYLYNNGVYGAIDNNEAQSIKLCDERDIKSYESLTTFLDRNSDSARYICR